MKIWQEELSFEYSKYLFGYCTYAIPDKEKMEEMYSMGFLPASRAGTKPKQFYMARSLRVALDMFELSSENRRVDGMYSFSRKVTPVSEFDFSDPVFKSIALSYMNNVISINGEEKLKYVLSAKFLTHIVTYSNEEEPKGYVFLVKDGEMTHYWLSFFSEDLVKKSFGIWMMLQEIQKAKEERHMYIYLGTCYGQKGRYKLNFPPFEFWDGNKWVENGSLLKGLLKIEE